MADVKDLLIRMSLDTSTFKRNIQTAKAELRTLKSEYKAVASSDDVGKAGEKLLSNLQEQKTVAEALVSEYNKGIESLRTQLQKATPGSQGAFQIEQQIQKLEEGLARARTQVNNLQSDIDGIKLDNFISKAETVASTFSSLRIGLGELLDGFGDTADSADTAFVSREAAFVSATKNVEDAHQTKEDLDALNQGLRTMTTVIPQTYEQLSALMGVGATLGVPYENLEKFTQVMAKLNVATNVQGETGAQLMAQLLNITEKDYGNIDRAGAALTELGNNSATTEQAILEMAQRAATGLSAVGMGLDDILAISAAINSVGINAEAGGSSVSKLAIKMDEAAKVGGQQIPSLLDTASGLFGQFDSIYDLYAHLDSLPSKDGWKAFESALDMTAADTKKLMNSALAAERFSKAMGMTVDEFSSGWNEDAASQMLSFFRTLGEMNGTEAGENMLWVMDQLGITEIRQSNMVRALAGNWELYARMLGLGRDAYAENVALENEAQRAFSTTESRRVMNANKEQNALEAMGETVTAMRKPFDDFFADVKQGFAEMPGWVQTAAGLVTQGMGSLGDALETAGKLSFSVVNIANAVKDLSGTALGAAILRKILGIGGAALSATPYVALAVGGNYLFSEMDKASTEKNWGEYNRTQEALDTYLTENADERVTRMQALLAGFSQAMSDFALNEDPMSDRTESLKNVFRQYANDLLREMPDLNIWKQMADSVNLSDGLDETEIEKIIGSMEFADQWLELGNEAVTSLAKGIKDREAELQSDTHAMGLSVDAGLAQGIYDGADEALAAASWLAGEIEETLRVDLDIHSPSGVARALGGYFAEGFAQGLEQGVSRVEGSMDRLTKAVTPKLDGNGNPVSREVRVIVNMDGKTMAQALAPMMDTALGDLSWDL